MPAKSKPLDGHKCEGAHIYFHVNCECGWSSGNFGSRKDAYSEFRGHVAEHRVSLAARDHGERTGHIVATNRADKGAKCTECDWVVAR